MKPLLGNTALKKVAFTDQEMAISACPTSAAKCG